MKIRTKLTLRFTVLVAGIFIVSMILVQVAAYYFWEQEFYKRLEKRAVTYANLLLKENTVDSSMLVLFDLYQQDKPKDEQIQIYNQAGKCIFSLEKGDTMSLASETIQTIRSKGVQKRKLDMDLELSFPYDLNGSVYFIVARGCDQVTQSYLKKMLQTRLLIAFIAIGLVALAGWNFSGRALRPLRRVMDELNSLSPDKPRQRLKETRHQDEIGALVATFNRLLQRIEEAFSLQKIFLSGASHEIRNPLTSITSQLQVLLMRSRSEEEYRIVLRSVLEDLAQLNKTTDDLIQYSSLSHDTDAMADVKPLRIDEVLWQCHEYFLKSKPLYAVRLDLSNLPEDEANLLLNGNENLLRVAFINLIDNACKFSRDQAARVRLHLERGHIQVTVTDNGVGMPPEVVTMIFEPFYRANHTSRLRGHGIGLSLVKRIFDLHEAGITVNSELGRGSIFTVSFPPFRQDSASV